MKINIGKVILIILYSIAIGLGIFASSISLLTNNKILEYIDWLETFGQFVSLDNIIIESKDNRLNFSILIRNFRGGV